MLTSLVLNRLLLYLQIFCVEEDNVNTVIGFGVTV